MNVPWFALLMLVLAAGCGRKGPPPLISPDGSLTLATSVEHSRTDPRAYLCVVFEIRDLAGKVLHNENTRASDLSQWQMTWVSTNKIKLESSDIGTYVWTKQAHGTWKKE
jgi:predicted small lipoprotein YifL